MRNIRILTFHSSENYGAVLQSYALLKYLKLSYPEDNIKIIDFQTQDHINNYKLFKVKNISRLKKLIIYTLILFKIKGLLLRKKRFKEFVKTKLDLTSRYTSEDELLNCNLKMDIVITGSDQVFNPNNKYYKAYYLGFKEKKFIKIAYAPSFGIHNFTQNISEQIGKYINDFDFTSCREEVGASFIAKITKKNVPTVCDPVFLLDKHEWTKIIGSKIIKEKYIFVYDLNGGFELIKIANKIKEVTGYKIICQTQTPQRFYQVDNQKYDLGPKEFLEHINYSEYVITDSFHGTAFSIIFNKKFYTYIAQEKSSSRIRFLLNKFNMNNNIIENGKYNEFCFNYSDNNNNGTKNNAFIKESMKFIDLALSIKE